MKQKAFTLIELLVVIVIIGILATLTTVTFQGSIEKANDIKRLSFMTDVYDEVQRTAIHPEYGYALVGIMTNPGGVGYDYLDKNIQQIVSEYFSGSLPGDNTCIFVGLARNSTNNKIEDDELVLVSWANGSSEVQVVGTDYWKNEIKDHAWTRDDFICDYDSPSNSWTAFTGTILPKFYPTGVTTESEFCDFIRPDLSCTGSNSAHRWGVQIIREDGDVCAFSQYATFPVVTTDVFSNCDDGY